MIVRYLLAALVAGLFSGVLMTAAQEARVVPLILHAEEFEGEAAPAGEGATPATTTDGAATTQEHSSLGAVILDVASALSPISVAYAHEGEDHEEGGIMFGMSRFSGTLLANLVTGTGFALLLAGFSLVSGNPITVANGALWGAAGWLAVHMLPAIGLPPELPGFPAADLTQRQIWWVATVALSAAGLYLLFLKPGIVAKIAGVVLLAAPQVYGAPQPSDISSNVPAVLGAEFAVAALATTLFFWVVLGLSLGFANEKIAKAA
ncbi:CbtA family protein [Shinella curvata]|uniref:CbtA family protein n=1 Tax=Shinella curvata TaxID=1817964 RepID=A0ABT8X7Z2_9HYPH|nr:CbtA family protein [Shinella curvata]MCJ8052219.1 CbtA family protein [Shinella curvata]MDO6119833.1 CbtA family protein [Shinella curvata]